MSDGKEFGGQLVLSDVVKYTNGLIGPEAFYGKQREPVYRPIGDYSGEPMPLSPDVQYIHGLIDKGEHDRLTGRQDIEVSQTVFLGVTRSQIQTKIKLGIEGIIDASGSVRGFIGMRIPIFSSENLTDISADNTPQTE